MFSDTVFWLQLWGGCCIPLNDRPTPGEQPTQIIPLQPCWGMSYLYSKVVILQGFAAHLSTATECVDDSVHRYVLVPSANQDNHTDTVYRLEEAENPRILFSTLNGLQTTLNLPKPRLIISTKGSPALHAGVCCSAIYVLFTSVLVKRTFLLCAAAKQFL